MYLQQVTRLRFLRVCLVVCLGMTAVLITVFSLQAAPPQEIDALPPPEYYISALDATKPEGDGPTLFTFLITRTGSANAGAQTVDFNVTTMPNAPSSQTVQPNDFGGLFPSGTLSLPQNIYTYTVAITIAGDEIGEADESFQITLTNLSWGDLIQPTAVGTIQNDDDIYLFLPAIRR